ncbi:MAPEG family protein [Microvirga sp. W0021]|uniref:MAPEG family protein n=1 Tax=Hohaiivirga grylli TaxID=3133970 RepID=A0ABV0BK81_9HYPH
MSVPAFLIPVFIQVALTFFLGIWLGKERGVAIKTGLVEYDPIYPVRWPEKTQKVSNSFHNQFEIPPLFYVVMILIIMTSKIDYAFAVLSWIFVISRIVHAGVHTTNNEVKYRGPAYLIGVLALLLMWIHLAIVLLLA